LANQSIFETAKLAVIENAFEADAKQLAKLLSPLLENKTTTVLLSERGKPVKALGFFLEKPAIFQEFKQLEEPLFTSFIIAEAKKIGLTVSSSAAHFLGTVYQGNTWTLVTELEKIVSLKKTIDKKDLDVLDLEVAPNYWALMNGLKSSDARVRLATLEKMLAMGDPPAKIFNILASQWQEKIPAIAEYDFMVKSGKLEYEEALVALLL
jgi:DNA polymerase III delta subunit